MAVPPDRRPVGSLNHNGNQRPHPFDGESPMATTQSLANRRAFLRTSLVAGLAAAAARRAGPRRPSRPPPCGDGLQNRPARTASRVALTAGNDRAANTFAGLKPFQERDRPGHRQPPRGHQAEQRGHRHPAFRHPRRLPGRHPGVPQVDRQARQGGDRRVGRQRADAGGLRQLRLPARGGQVRREAAGSRPAAARGGARLRREGFPPARGADVAAAAGPRTASSSRPPR